MPDGQFAPEAPRRLLLVALGRQRVGKTALLNMLVQYFRAMGCEMEVWNADLQNETHSLSKFFPDAKVPPDGGLADTRGWIESQLKDQIKRGYHAVLDAGGGLTAFSELVKDVPVLQTLAAEGTDVIGLFCVGPEQADLDYLNHFSGDDMFVPKATAIILNGGLVLSGRSSKSAFSAVRQNAAFQAALARGAKTLTMPGLSCMAEVTDRHLTFAEAAGGIVRPGQEPMSLFDPARVREWWTKKVPEFFGKFPPEWLPSPHTLSAAMGGEGHE